MKKAQIFTLDAFLALLAVTIILGYLTWETEEAYKIGGLGEQQKLERIADDWAHIAVKNLLLTADNKPNLIKTPTSSDSLSTQMQNAIKDPYAYELLLPGTTIAGNGGCAGKANIAAADRIVYHGSSAEVLTVKVCA